MGKRLRERERERERESERERARARERERESAGTVGAVETHVERRIRRVGVGLTVLNGAKDSLLFRLDPSSLDGT